MADIIQQRRDTAARWAQYNPILLEGEVGYVTDNPNQYKIGNGRDKWNDLPLRGYTGTITQDTGDDENAVMSQKAVSAKLSELGSEVNEFTANKRKPSSIVYSAKRTGRYVNKDTGKITESTSGASIMLFQVSKNSIYKLRIPISGNTASLVYSYYDDYTGDLGKNDISTIPLEPIIGNSDKVEIEIDTKEHIGVLVTYLEEGGYPSLFLVEDISHVEEEISEDIYSDVAPIQIISGKYISVNGNLSSSSAGAKVAIYPVNIGRYQLSIDKTGNSASLVWAHYDGTNILIPNNAEIGKSIWYDNVLEINNNFGYIAVCYVGNEPSLKSLTPYNNKMLIDDVISRNESNNIYDGNVSYGYINSTGGFAEMEGENFVATGLIPISPNSYYYISNRHSGTTNVRCLLSDKVTPLKVLIASTGNEYSDGYKMPKQEGGGETFNGMIKTPSNAAYLQVQLQFNNGGSVVNINPYYKELMVEFAGTTYNSNYIPIPYTPSVGHTTAKTERVLKVLCFGNSFTEDSMMYVPMVLRNIKSNVKFDIGLARIGGCTLAQHLANFNNASVGEYNPTVYSFCVSYRNGAWCDYGQFDVDSLLKFEDWDIITFQQSGQIAFGDYDTYFKPYINELTWSLYKKAKSSVKLGFILTHGSYNSDSDELRNRWEGTVENVKKVLETSSFSFVLPYGTAIENLRTTEMKDLGITANLLADDVHIQEGIGNLAAAYTNALKLLQISGEFNTCVYGDKSTVSMDVIKENNIQGMNPSPISESDIIGMTARNRYIAQVAALKAVSNPYILTDLSGL